MNNYKYTIIFELDGKDFEADEFAPNSWEAVRQWAASEKTFKKCKIVKVLRGSERYRK